MAATKFKNVRFFRLSSTWYEDPAMKKIKRLPDGHMILAVFCEILAMCAQVNGGGFLIQRDIPCTPDDISIYINESIANTNRALEVLTREGILEIVFNEDDIPTFHVKNWDKWQVPQMRSNALPADDMPALPEKPPTAHAAEIEEIVAYLNNAAGKKFRTSTPQTKRDIIARIHDGYTVNDFKKVIDNKCREWKNDQKMNKYLRPQTLFGTKFEAYLNEGGNASQIDDTADIMHELMEIHKMDASKQRERFITLPDDVQKAVRTCGGITQIITEYGGDKKFAGALSEIRKE